MTTSNVLYVWKHHRQRLVNIIESSLEYSKGHESVEGIATTSLTSDDGRDVENDSDDELDPDPLFLLADDEMVDKPLNVLFTPPSSIRGNNHDG